MKANKAYILMIDTELSREYSKCAAESCDKVGLEWEYFLGYREKDDINSRLPVKSPAGIKLRGKGGACTAGHIHIWHEISKSDSPAIILEHDAIMLHNPKIDIPDGVIVVLGYKVRDPENYDYKKAGPPKAIQSRKRHGGAHAYALTPETAKTLIKNIEKDGLNNMIDNHFFLRQGSSKRYSDKVPLSITDPICALGWLRKSTIWNKAAVDNYRPILNSFTENYHSKEDLGLKGP